ncbi:hypothetical protein [Paenibacillus lautus]|uniref:hypothetical protein n=1 Tax=Paenibacillus lautus TaxID=1401 RepID=UPI003D28A840
MISLNDTPVPRSEDIDITTFAELMNAIENANDGDVLNLNITNDLLFTSSVVIRRS